MLEVFDFSIHLESGSLGCDKGSQEDLVIVTIKLKRRKEDG
jgi:hypothetical protein